MCKSPKTARRECFVFLFALVLVAVGARPSAACRTPVFRYAMMNWATAPYVVVYFYEGEVAAEDVAVNKALNELADAEPPANVILEKVDVADEKQFSRLPKFVKDAREEHPATPLHMVISPSGSIVFTGRLDQKTVDAMVDSPLRKRIGELFDEGKGAAMLILTGPDNQANEKAEATLREAIEKMAPEEEDEEEKPDEADGEADKEADAEEEPVEDYYGYDEMDEQPKLELAVLKVSRTDPAEQWLVRMLMGVEKDLKDFPKDVMIFAVYGRGRALPPCLGKGINVDNLCGDIAFLNGPCSCQVKDLNPGVDLLMRRDWFATAEAWAAEEEEQYAAGPMGYGEFDPENTQRNDEPASTNDTEPETEPAQTTEPAASDERPPASDKPAEQPQPETAVAVPEPAAQPQIEKAPKTLPEPAESFAERQSWKLGIGLAAGVLVIFSAGFVFIMLRRPA